MAKYYFLLELEPNEIPAKINTETGQVTQMISKAPVAPVQGKTYPPLKLESIMRFGKYKGEILIDVMHKDIDYAKWFIEKYNGKIDVDVMSLFNTIQKESYIAKIQSK